MAFPSGGTWNTPSRALWLALLVAALLRLGWIAICPNQPVSDQVIYHTSAARIAEGQGYVDDDGQPANYWPVGYAALLAVPYSMAGPSPFAGFMLNLLLGLSLVPGLYLLAKELWGAECARYAAWIAALFPTFIVQTTVLSSESAYLPGLAWCAWLFVRSLRAPHAAWAALAGGVLWGALVLVRPPALVLPAALLVFAFWDRIATRDLVRTIAIVAIAGAAVMAPWSLRNARHFGALTPLSLNGGANLWMGNHEGANGEYIALPAEYAALPLLERERVLKDEAVRFIKEHPLRYAALSFRRTLVSMRSDTNAADWSRVGITATFGERGVLAVKLACTGAYYLLLAAALTALVLRVRRRRFARPELFLLALAALNAIPFVLIVAQNRYAMPLLPLYAAGAATLALVGGVEEARYTASRAHEGIAPAARISL